MRTRQTTTKRVREAPQESETDSSSEVPVEKKRQVYFSFLDSTYVVQASQKRKAVSVAANKRAKTQPPQNLTPLTLETPPQPLPTQPLPQPTQPRAQTQLQSALPQSLEPIMQPLYNLLQDQQRREQKFSGLFSIFSLVLHSP
jgi:hypothetical protein